MRVEAKTVWVDFGGVEEASGDAQLFGRLKENAGIGVSDGHGLYYYI